MSPTACYTFYPETAAGSRVSLEVIELSGDNAARARALDVLMEHDSAACVEVWCGDRYVGRVDGRALGRRHPTPMRSPREMWDSSACDPS